MVLRTTRVFLEQRHAIEYVNSFDAIIKHAHSIVVQKSSGASGTAPAEVPTATVTASAPSPSADMKSGDSKKISEADRDLSGPAADLIATTISLFKRADQAAAASGAAPPSAANDKSSLRRATKQQHNRAATRL